MYIYPLETPDPLGKEVLLAVAAHFWMTWVTEALCIVGVLVFGRRQVINAKV